MSKTHYDELVEQLDVVLSNKPLLEVMDKSLHNESPPTDYDAWVENSLSFLQANKSLFVKEDAVDE